MAGRSVQIGAVMIMAFAVIILNMLASSSCKQLRKTIGEKERQLAKLEDEHKRESTRREELQTPERLKATLLRHGLSMDYPKELQIVRMGADGRPYPGQLSVAKATQRNKSVVASVVHRSEARAASARAAQPRASVPRKARR